MARTAGEVRDGDQKPDPRHQAILAVVVLVAALALSGCGGPQGGDKCTQCLITQMKDQSANFAMPPLVAKSSDAPEAIATVLMVQKAREDEQNNKHHIENPQKWPLELRDAAHMLRAGEYGMTQPYDKMHKAALNGTSALGTALYTELMVTGSLSSTQEINKVRGAHALQKIRHQFNEVNGSVFLRLWIMKHHLSIQRVGTGFNSTTYVWSSWDKRYSLADWIDGKRGYLRLHSSKEMASWLSSDNPPKYGPNTSGKGLNFTEALKFWVELEQTYNAYTHSLVNGACHNMKCAVTGEFTCPEDHGSHDIPLNTKRKRALADRWWKGMRELFWLPPCAEQGQKLKTYFGHHLGSSKIRYVMKLYDQDFCEFSGELMQHFTQARMDTADRPAQPHHGPGLVRCASDAECAHLWDGDSVCCQSPREEHARCRRERCYPPEMMRSQFVDSQAIRELGSNVAVHKGKHVKVVKKKPSGPAPPPTLAPPAHGDNPKPPKPADGKPPAPPANGKQQPKPQPENPSLPPSDSRDGKALLKKMEQQEKVNKKQAAKEAKEAKQAKKDEKSGKKPKPKKPKLSKEAKKAAEHSRKESKKAADEANKADKQRAEQAKKKKAEAAKAEKKDAARLKKQLKKDQKQAKKEAKKEAKKPKKAKKPQAKKPQAKKPHAKNPQAKKPQAKKPQAKKPQQPKNGQQAAHKGKETNTPPAKTASAAKAASTLFSEGQQNKEGLKVQYQSSGKDFWDQQYTS